MKLPLAVLLSSLTAFSAAAQTADLSLKLEANARYNAGELGTLRATVTNAGPDAATAAGVRLTKPSGSFVGASRFGCIEFTDSILCNVPALAAGDFHPFVIPFVPPDDAGPLRLNARTESFSLDPNHDNDSASTTVEVDKLADLSIEASVYPSLRVGHASRLFVTVRQHAALRPDSATIFATFPDSVAVGQSNPTCINVDATSLRCTLRTMGSDIGTYIDVVPKRNGGPVTIALSVESPEAEWNPSDNRVSLALPVYDVPDLDVQIVSPDALDDANRTVAAFTFSNPGDVPATDVQAEIITYPGNPDPVVAGGWACQPSATYRLQCTNPLIAPHSSSTLPVNVQFDRRYLRGEFVTNVTMKPASDATFPPQTFSADAVFYKPFTVTTTADSGAGSLRQTILDANAECSTDDGNPPCKIVFATSGGTIAPLSQLPLVTVTDFAIDGESKITLDGGMAGDADGLYLFNVAAVVRGLAIHNFSRNGVLSITHVNPFLSRHHVIEKNDLSDNGLRGIMGYNYQGEITSNAIHGNGRSGIFLTEVTAATIRDNTIGDDGASGIYVGGGTAVIEKNTISGEHEFGVAIDRGANAQVLENTITKNGAPGIDVGLDGPTPGRAPVIASAQFDPATGETVVEGTIPPFFTPYPVTSTAYVYANTTDEAGGETFLGAVNAAKDGRFTLRYNGDLTGKFVDASANVITDFGDFVLRASTEFGNRVRVER